MAPPPNVLLPPTLTHTIVWLPTKHNATFWVWDCIFQHIWIRHSLHCCQILYSLWLANKASTIRPCPFLSGVGTTSICKSDQEVCVFPINTCSRRHDISRSQYRREYVSSRLQTTHTLTAAGVSCHSLKSTIERLAYGERSCAVMCSDWVQRNKSLNYVSLQRL